MSASGRKRHDQERRSRARRRRHERQAGLDSGDQTLHRPPAEDGEQETVQSPFFAPDPGGLGGVLSTLTKTIRLEQQALRQRWPIKPEHREPLLLRQITIALDPKTPPRQATSAFRTLLSADALNLQDEERRRERLLGEILDCLDRVVDQAQPNRSPVWQG
jgi:hypothetical protein